METDKHQIANFKIQTSNEQQKAIINAYPGQ